MTGQRNIDSSLIDRVAEFGANIRFGDIPTPVIEATKNFLADTCAVTIAGHVSPSTAPILETAKIWDGEQAGTARVFGDSHVQLSPANAAFVNGYKAHCLEWDSLHEAAISIGFCTPVGALLAECEVRKVTGEDFLAALIAAAEFFTILGLSSGSTATFFRPSAGGTISAALAIARVRNYSVELTQQTLGLAYSLAGGTMQAHWEGTSTLSMQVGAGSRSAIYAADLAENGIAAPVDIFTGKFGFFSIFERMGNFAELSHDLGKVWRIPETAYKPFPCGRATHGVLTVLRDMKSAGTLDPDEIAKVTVTAPPLISVLVDREIKEEMSPGYARLCLPFVLPMFAYHGDIDPRAFTDPVRPTARGLALAKKLEIKVIKDAPENTLSPVEVDIVMNDGTRHTATCHAPWGSIERPFTGNDLLEKIAKCLDYAEMDIVASDFARVFEEFDAHTDVRTALTPIYN